MSPYMRLAYPFAIVAVLAACGFKKQPESAPAEEAKAVAAAQPPLLGEWCMQSQALSLTDKKIPDGSKWEFAADGTYEYAHKWHRQSGTWEKKGDTLSISNVGDHAIVELDAQKMVLKRGSYQFFGRDCGPEYAKAQLVQQLVQAASEGSVDRVEQTLNAGADVNGVDHLTVIVQSPLAAAVRDGHLSVVELLLRRGADPNLDEWQDAPIAIAERLGHAHIAAALVRAGARPTVRAAPDEDDEAAATGQAQPAEPVRNLAEAARDPSKLDPNALSVASAVPPTTARPSTYEAAADDEWKPDEEVPAAADPSPGRAPPEACAYRKESMRKAQSGEMDAQLSAMRTTREEFVARQQELYDQECN